LSYLTNTARRRRKTDIMGGSRHGIDVK